MGNVAKNDFVVILDNGHGLDTPGKRSPKWNDGSQLFEYEFNRNIAKRIATMLNAEGIKYRLLVPEVIDISLGERCRRANRIYDETNGKCFVVSIHANASGGTGWEVYTSKGQTKADAIATVFYNEAKKAFPEQRVRTDYYTDGDPDKESQFYILVHTKAPAILTENFFMDNEKDCRLIMSEEGRERIARFHVEAIKKIIL